MTKQTRLKLSKKLKTETFNGTNSGGGETYRKGNKIEQRKFYKTKTNNKRNIIMKQETKGINKINNAIDKINPAYSDELKDLIFTAIKQAFDETRIDDSFENKKKMTEYFIDSMGRNMSMEYKEDMERSFMWFLDKLIQDQKQAQNKYLNK